MTLLTSLAFIVYLLLTIYWFNSLPVRKAVLHALLFGWLFLPEKATFRIPMLPEMDKDIVPTLLCLVLNFFLGRRFLKDTRLGGPIKWLAIFLLISNIPRVMLNLEPVYANGGVVVQGIPPRQIITMAIQDLVLIVGTFRLGMGLATRRDWLLEALKTWFSYLLVYCFLCLWEIRFSPQLHTKLYGYFQHSFAQMIREGGYRPIVFMEHGLAVGLYLFIGATLSMALRAEKVKSFGLRPGQIAFVSSCVLLVSKCVASFSYFMITMGTMMLKGRRTQTVAALGIAALILVMPVLRVSHAIPLDEIGTWSADHFGAERTQSLMYRFENEERLVEYVAPRKWFGYAGAGRGAMYADDGRPDTVTDSYWIITWMDRGYVGYWLTLGLLCWPLLRLGNSVKRARDDQDKRLIAGFGMVGAMSVLDLMVNGLFNPFAILLLGILWGASRSNWAEQGAAARSLPPQGYQPSMYPPGQPMASYYPMPGAPMPGYPMPGYAGPGYAGPGYADPGHALQRGPTQSMAPNPDTEPPGAGRPAKLGATTSTTRRA